MVEESKNRLYPKKKKIFHSTFFHSDRIEFRVRYKSIFSHHVLIFTYVIKNWFYPKKKKIFHLSTLIASSFEYDNESVIFLIIFFTSRNRKIGCIRRKRKYFIRHLSTLIASSFEYNNESVIFFTTFFLLRGIEKSVVSEEKENILFDIFPLWSHFRKYNFSHRFLIFTYVVEESKNRLYPKKKKIFHSISFHFNQVSSCESLIFFHYVLIFTYVVEESKNRLYPKKKKIFHSISFHSDIFHRVSNAKV